MSNLSHDFIRNENRHYYNSTLSKGVVIRRVIQLLLFALLMILAFSAFSQHEGHNHANINQEKMENFHYMVGEWEGMVDIPNRDGSIAKIHQHEKVELKLKGTMLLIEGTGKDENGEVVFNAIANLFYDAKADAFKMLAFRSNGQFVEAAVDIQGEQSFNWSFSPSEENHVRYETKISETGAWQENGFFSKDGITWNPFFEMELDKVE